ncbi:hypothetical protein [Mesorhizobium sp.]|uniref:hypothetical protein n=1 Tax=Mesorhizobium sp. TaxID=1871066 RepID=UPI000FE9D48D|nr:hypothetical protein [Mesorhizobium sp.]RWA77143.1 MAG: hypothetical protein EOQ30_33055 [Mesorhizobium sp.]
MGLSKNKPGHQGPARDVGRVRSQLWNNLSPFGVAACLVIAGRCAYALMISQPAPSLAQTQVDRCEFFLLMLKSDERASAYKALSAIEQVDPPKVTIEFEIRNKAHAPGRTTGSCEFDRDRRHITFFTFHGLRSQILQ